MKTKIHKVKKFNTADVLMVAFLSLFGLCILYPFYNAILVSIVPQQVYVRTPFMIYPVEIDLSSYRFVFASKAISSGFKNTSIILVLGVIYNMLLTVCTAYALTKAIPGRKFFNLMIIFTLYFSGGLIPFYLLIKNIGLMNNIFAMILPTGINISSMLVTMRFFNEIPKELEESARIDGANDLTVLWKIILPLSLPILATFSLYYGVDRWNEWWNGMLFIKSSSKLPLQTVLRNIIQDASEIANNIPVIDKRVIFTDGIKMATVVVTMFPIMCLYPFLQRYFVSGLTAGAVKA